MSEEPVRKREDVDIANNATSAAKIAGMGGG